MKRWRVGIVGAGAIGTRRARVAQAHPETSVVLIADSVAEKAEKLATEVGARSTTDWSIVTSDANVDVVIVATPTDSHAPVTLAAFKNHKHVLCEKPLAREPREALRMVRAGDSAGLKLKTGFNHRHHPAIFKAHEMVLQDEIGRLLFARCLYGHGGRRGYELEWRMQPRISGGGELLDQGVHALDLFRWFLGDFQEVIGIRRTLFWPIGPVEDNAFAILQSKDGCIAQLHATWTQWKNRFSFEVYGEKGYLCVNGLGGSYGEEQLIIGRRREPGEVPHEEVMKFGGRDLSWEAEWNEFIESLRSNKEPLASGRDGYEALRLVHAIYRSSELRRVVRIRASRPTSERGAGEESDR